MDKVVTLVGGGSVINGATPSSFERPGSLGADSLKIHAIVIVNHELGEGAPFDYNISLEVPAAMQCMEKCRAIQCHAVQCSTQYYIIINNEVMKIKYSV